MIKTKYGNAYVKDGYLRISASDKHYGGKYLHRLIYEEHYGTIPKNYVIHHKNENKTDNRIENLIAMPLKEHIQHHTKGEQNPMYGKPLSKAHREKLSNAKKGKALGKLANNSKYSLWNSANAILEKNRINVNKPTRCFKFNYKGFKMPIGMFNEWISCDLINSLIEEAIT